MQRPSAVKMVQIGEDPREQWIAQFLERTRTEEAKCRFRAVLGAYTLRELEVEFSRGVRGQQEIVAQCSSPLSDPELRANLAAYLERFPGIPGKVAFKDTSIAKMAVAVAGEAPHSGAPAPHKKVEALVSHLPLGRDGGILGREGGSCSGFYGQGN